MEDPPFAASDTERIRRLGSRCVDARGIHAPHKRFPIAMRTQSTIQSLPRRSLLAGAPLAVAGLLLSTSPTPTATDAPEPTHFLEIRRNTPYDDADDFDHDGALAELANTVSSFLGNSWDSQINWVHFVNYLTLRGFPITDQQHASDYRYKLTPEGWILTICVAELAFQTELEGSTYTVQARIESF
ncbi:MAG: hypothetical protein GY711_20935 [bacterium]|nr:hypothetical protein [bacterium]